MLEHSFYIPNYIPLFIYHPDSELMNTNVLYKTVPVFFFFKIYTIPIVAWNNNNFFFFFKDKKFEPLGWIGNSCIQITFNENGSYLKCLPGESRHPAAKCERAKRRVWLSAGDKG